ncbi:MAG: hypothetical protein M0R17_02095 [Candidatus Omnitrophica bacterium]|jgi:hypothetical protein|nr:hypothetical protein [Candidatus Omnitrophota bacterium]
MNIARIDNIKIPMTYSKRGKGHTDVIVSISVEVAGSVDAIEISDKIYPYGGSVCSIDCIEKLLDTLKLQYSVRKFYFQFDLMMERITTKHTKSYFPMLCSYIYDRSLGPKSYIGVDMPIRISELSGTQSNLRLMLKITTLESFEDMLDWVQKLTKFDMFPQAAFWQDKETDVVSLQDVFSRVKKYFKQKKIKGYVELSGRDALNNRVVNIQTTF